MNGVETTDNGTPLHWAMYGRTHAPIGARDPYNEVIERLIRAGAAIDQRPKASE